MKKKIVIILTLLPLMFSSCLRNDEDYSNEYFPINIKVDPTIELFCTIHRLAYTDQYTTNEFPPYIGKASNLDHLWPE